MLHSAVKWVKTPLFTTVLQISSRVFIVWCVLVAYGNSVVSISHSWTLVAMIVAWCFAEMTRYAYYAASILQHVPKWLTWCRSDFCALLSIMLFRYTFFFVLYPIGAGGEMLMVIKSISKVGESNNVLALLYMAIAAIYPPGIQFS